MWQRVHLIEVNIQASDPAEELPRLLESLELGLNERRLGRVSRDLDDHLGELGVRAPGRSPPIKPVAPALVQRPRAAGLER